MNIVNAHINSISPLCLKHKVKELCVFGSVLTDAFSAESDVDFLVSFNKENIADYFENFFDLKYALESLLGRKVDLVEEQCISNPYFVDSVNRTKQKIYG